MEEVQPDEKTFLSVKEEFEKTIGRSGTKGNEGIASYEGYFNDKIKLEQDEDKNSLEQQGLEEGDLYYFEYLTKIEKLNNNHNSHNTTNAFIIKEEPEYELSQDSTKDKNYFNTGNPRSDKIKEEEPLDIIDNIKPENIKVEDFSYEDINVSTASEEEKLILENPAMTTDRTTDDKIYKRYPCNYCDKMYVRRSHAMRHMKNECHEVMEITSSGTRKTKYYCKKCDKYFMGKHSLVRHNFFIHESNVAKGSCGTCLQVFEDKKIFEKHMRNCGGSRVNEYKCENCNRKYRDSLGLRRHVKDECGKEPRFGCAHCDYRTVQKINIVRHFKRMHSNELTRVKCPNCPKSYKNGCTLKRHVQFECGKEPSFACECCNYKTKRKSCLQAHMINKHKKKCDPYTIPFLGSVKEEDLEITDSPPLERYGSDEESEDLERNSTVQDFEFVDLNALIKSDVEEKDEEEVEEELTPGKKRITRKRKKVEVDCLQLIVPKKKRICKDESLKNKRQIFKEEINPLRERRKIVKKKERPVSEVKKVQTKRKVIRKKINTVQEEEKVDKNETKGNNKNKENVADEEKLTKAKQERTKKLKKSKEFNENSPKESSTNNEEKKIEKKKSIRVRKNIVDIKDDDAKPVRKKATRKKVERTTPYKGGIQARFHLHEKIDFYCATCDETHKNIVGTKQTHCPKCNSSYFHRCLTCNRRYKNYNDVTMHLKYVCNLPPKFCCDHCGFRTHRKSRLVTHIRNRHMAGTPNHALEPVYCPKCSKCYFHKRYLRYHINSECGINLQLPCPHCDYKAKNKTFLRKHIKHIHERDVNGYFCPRCNRRYVAQRSMQTHYLRICGKEKPLSCEHCDYKAWIKHPSMSRHIQRNHRELFGESDFNCRYCKKYYSNAYSMNSHIRNNTMCAQKEKERLAKKAKKNVGITNPDTQAVDEKSRSQLNNDNNTKTAFTLAAHSIFS